MYDNLFCSVFSYAKIYLGRYSFIFANIASTVGNTAEVSHTATTKLQQHSVIRALNERPPVSSAAYRVRHLDLSTHTNLTLMT